MRASDFRAKAREALRGNWVLSVIVTLVATLLGAGSGTGGGGTGGSALSGGSQGGDIESVVESIGSIPPVIIGIVVAIISILAIYVIIALIFGGATKLGLVLYNVDLVTKRKEPAFSTLFSRYPIFVKAFLLQLMMSVFIILWAFLLIIPGIIAAFRYAMAPYIMAENPEMNWKEAIDLSKKMMHGNKWRLFCLEFSFIGWHIVCMLTFGIGYLWLNPYIGVSEAAFYISLKDETPEIAESAGIALQ